MLMSVLLVRQTVVQGSSVSTQWAATNVLPSVPGDLSSSRAGVKVSTGMNNF